MIDRLLRGGTVVDGTGAPGVVADVGIAGGRVVGIGPTDEAARETVDVDGMVVAPGFIDLHTHYDAQALWDPTLSPSPLHGVTTVIGGNCGFTIAPLGSEHAEYVMRMMARVEGMSLRALEAGPEWTWNTFGEFLDRLDGSLAINAAFMVGHSTLRRVAMGDAAVGGTATGEQIDTMVALAHEAMGAGAFGLSSSLGDAHTDGDGAPVPSRSAQRDEFLALAAAVRDHPGTTLEFIPAVGEISDDRMQLMADMSLAANRPLNWNLLGSLSPTEIYEQQLRSSDVATAKGARVMALTLPDLMRMRASHLLGSMPGWRNVMRMPDDERRAALRDEALRARLRDGVEQAARGGLDAMNNFDLIEIADGAYAGRTVAAVAHDLGVEPSTVLIDVVLADLLPLTLVLPSLVPSLGASREGWVERARIWRDPRVMLGGSDAGAHVDLMCHANYPTVVLGHAARDLGVVTVEEAVHLMTERPARLLGLRERGRIAAGFVADLVVFDPDRVASKPAQLLHDMPAGAERLHAAAIGVERVIVGGRDVCVGGAFTGDRAGQLLRSGRDTDTVTVPGGATA
ncbi:MAG TPA: amidohydrolase family protein [Acidimicrobiia bacterium]